MFLLRLGKLYNQDSVQKRSEFQKVSIAEAAANSDQEKKPNAFLFRKMDLICVLTISGKV